ncbi:MAG: diacylglycerol kinase [Clostridia bacterium]|nr:diacylglycerol kinase [Clostridia bacterium]
MEYRTDPGKNVPESPIRTKSLIDSVRYAFRGLFYGFRTERNFMTYLCIIVVLFVVNLIIGIRPMEHLAFFICAIGAVSAEFTNTAIEHIANYLTTDLHESIRRAKDLGAAAVLVWGFVFFGFEGVLLCRAFFG